MTKDKSPAPPKPARRSAPRAAPGTGTPSPSARASAPGAAAARPKTTATGQGPGAGRPPLALEPARIQKVLADAGLGSRREIEGWIAAGRIQINGRVAKLGDRLGPGDQVRLDGKPLRLTPAAVAAPPRVIAYHKPEGEIVTRHDPEGRPTVFDRLPPLERGRWIAIGRLDINTSGLLLLTNQGELAHRLMHPSREIEREYAVRILGTAPREALQRLVHGVELDDGPARFEEIVESDTSSRGANRWYHVLLREGRNREVRRLWEAVGVKVSRLMRVRFGNVILEPHLFSHQWRDLTPEELKGLLDLAGMTPPAPPRPPPRHPGPWPGRPPQGGRREATPTPQRRPRRKEG